MQSLSELAALCRENDVSLTYLMPPSTILKGVTRLPMGVVDDTDAVCSEFVDLATQKGIDVLASAISLMTDVDLKVAGTGPIPIISGAQPATAMPR